MVSDSGDLQVWLHENGVTWDSQMITLSREDENSHTAGAGGVRVLAANDVANGDVLASIPKRMLLSVLNTGIRAELANHKLKDELGVALALMFERSLGKDSPWYGYIYNLPVQEDVPLFWSTEALGTYF